MPRRHPYKDWSDICEYSDDNGHLEPPDDCMAQHTHLIVSHDYPTQRITRSCSSHVLEMAYGDQLSVFTVVDVRMHEQMKQDLAYQAEAMQEEQATEGDPF